MTKFVTTFPQAATYWGSVEIPRAEVEPQLEELWEERKIRFKSVNRPGFRPGKAPPPKRSEVEAEHLFDLYSDKWGILFVRGIEEYLKSRHKLLDGETLIPTHLYRVCHAVEITVVRRGDRYLISGVYFLWPSVEEKPDLQNRLQEVKEVALSVADMAKHLQSRRLQQELAPGRVKRETEGEIKIGDFLEVEMATDIAQDYGQPAQTVLVEMCDELQYDVREALIGRQLGEVVIMPWKMNVGTPDERHLKRILKVKTRLVPQSLTDDELFKLEGVSGWDELKTKAQAEFSAHQQLTLKSRIEEIMLGGFRFGPIPGPWAVDRAEGFYNSAIQQHKSEGQFLKALGAKDRASALHGLVPMCQRTIKAHLASAYLCSTSTKRTFPPPELAEDIRLVDWQMSLYMELEYLRLEVEKTLLPEGK